MRLVSILIALTVVPCTELCADVTRVAQDGLVLSWDAADATVGDRKVSRVRIPDRSGHGNLGYVVGPARLLSKPPRIELDGKAAIAGPRPIRTDYASIDIVCRIDRVYSAGLQLIFTGHERARADSSTVHSGNPRQWVLEIRGAPPEPRNAWRGHLSFGVFGMDSQWHFALSNRPVTRGWHHVVGTFDGRHVRLYIDGKLQSVFHPAPAGVYQGRMNHPPDDTVRVPAVGTVSSKGRYGFDGAVAGVRLYDRGLTADEVGQLWDNAQKLGITFGTAPRPTAHHEKPSFKVLFSNDTTNVLTCTSPYHKKGQPFTEDMLRATIDEAKGVDVHMLQPGLGWIPWWKSRQYPIDEHAHWFHSQTGRELSSFGQYMLAGGDIVGTFVEYCRKQHVVPFVSFRLNDGHHLENVGTKEQRAEWVSRFYAEHPEYRLGPDRNDWNQHVHNWAIPQVREHKFGFLREICEQYDIDGLELDFMRHAQFFRVAETTFKQRSRIMTDFVRRVRTLLDRTAKPGQHRWLCARVPLLLANHDSLGIDLPSMVDAGLDMVNLSASYFTVQQSDMEQICRLVPDTAVYLEMTHCTTTGPSRGGYDSFRYLRTTDQQFYTGAHLAYQRGAVGVSLFNFVYYREHGTPGRGPFNEPPFHVLSRLGQPDWLARQPQWYVIAKTWFPQVESPQVPFGLAAGKSRVIQLDLAPITGPKPGLLRLRTETNCTDRVWAVTLNGQALRPSSPILKPISHPYDAALGIPDQYACFTVPRSIPRQGINDIRVTLKTGRPVDVDYVDLVLP